MSVPQPVISKGLVPLLDIIFILLIFFLILPHSMKGEDTLYDETSAALKQFDAKLVPIESIHLKKDFTLILKNQKFSPERLFRHLSSIDPITFVMIYVDADEKADHATERDVVLVKQLLEKAKIKNYVVGLTSR